MGILVASGQIRASGGAVALLGELSLTGAVRPVTGTLPMLATLGRAGHRRVVVPTANVGEARLADGVQVIGVADLPEAARLVAGPRGRTAQAAVLRDHQAVSAVPQSVPEDVRRSLVQPLRPVDLAEIRGQLHARWALEVALAGGHNLLMVGPNPAADSASWRGGMMPVVVDLIQRIRDAQARGWRPASTSTARRIRSSIASNGVGAVHVSRWRRDMGVGTAA